MNRYISEKLRLDVALLANFRCEYCRIHEDDLFFSYQIDHIISIKHGGETDLENLAYSCSMCNQNKGSNLGTYLPDSKRLVRLFHPRKDTWKTHFKVNNGEIIGKTKIGLTTIKVLDLNNVDRVILRQILTESGRY
ncbi:HNH endonuclease [Arcicella aurantiaca]|uniref:HNH endonuclease n=1 Tax=Arcicella aurantiaca TaxID=591202 RepID=A0A316EI82_9BACT|nr:HNH endonuclease [Arcicella aurantiaca]PWK28548.1 HNH endonuclease [Arcicella aurantiaca]